MSSLPQFGGTNGVGELNAGQPGSALYAANQAHFICQVIEGPDQAAAVPQALVQQNVTFEDRLGFRSSIVTWEGSLKVVSDAVRQVIYSQLNAYRHGSATVNGILQPPNPSQMKPTTLINSFGSVLSTRAVLVDWMGSEVDRITGKGAFTLLVPRLKIVFQKL